MRTVVPRLVAWIHDEAMASRSCRLVIYEILCWNDDASSLLGSGPHLCKAKAISKTSYQVLKVRTSSLPSQLPHSLFGPLSSHYKGEDNGQIHKLVDIADKVYSLLDVNGYLLGSEMIATE